MLSIQTNRILMLIFKHFDFFGANDFLIIGKQIIQLTFTIKWMFHVQLEPFDTEAMLIVKLRFLIVLNLRVVV